MEDVTHQGGSGQWYLFDYGNVISTEPEPADWAALQRVTGLQLEPASSPYWVHRADFDAGAVSPAEYWAAVLGPSCMNAEMVDAEMVRVLEDLDAAQWSHLNRKTLRMLETLERGGAQLALLSNMPARMSERYLREAPWAAYFTRTFFSGQLGMIKPDTRIFDHVLKELAAAPGDVVFIDDNLPNIEAARSLGLRTVHFGPETDLERELAK